MITASIFAPSNRISGPAASSATSVRIRIVAIAPSTTSDACSPWLRLINSMTVAIEPGPAIIGIAMGKIDTSSASCGSSATLAARSSRRCVRFSNTISSAIRNSMMPPAMRKAGISMPRPCSNASPNSAKTNRMTEATKTARIAIARRCCGVAPADSPA